MVQTNKQTNNKTKNKEEVRRLVNKDKHEVKKLIETNTKLIKETVELTSRISDRIKKYIMLSAQEKNLLIIRMYQKDIDRNNKHLSEMLSEIQELMNENEEYKKFVYSK